MNVLWRERGHNQMTGYARCMLHSSVHRLWTYGRRATNTTCIEAVSSISRQPAKGNCYSIAPLKKHFGVHAGQVAWTRQYPYRIMCLSLDPIARRDPTTSGSSIVAQHNFE